MVSVTITDTFNQTLVRLVDKMEIRGDMIYMYKDEYKDRELAATEKLVLVDIIKFTRVEIEEIDDDEEIETS